MLSGSFHEGRDSRFEADSVHVVSFIQDFWFRGVVFGLVWMAVMLTFYLSPVRFLRAPLGASTPCQKGRHVGLVVVAGVRMCMSP